MIKKVLIAILAIQLLFSSAVMASAVSPFNITAIEKATITIKNIEKNIEPIGGAAGIKVTVTAYKIMDTSFNSNSQMPPTYSWTNTVAAWISSKVEWGASQAPNTPIDAKAFYEKMAEAITKGQLTPLISSNNFTPKSGARNSDNLEMGQYIVLITGGMKVYEPMIAEIKPVNVAGVWTLPDIMVIAKSTEPSVIKTVNNGEHETVSIGDTVIFNIIADVPKYPDNATSSVFKIRDIMSKGLSFNRYSLNIDGLTGDESELIDPSAYTMTISPDNALYTFSVDFVYAGVKQYDRVRIEYTAKVNSEIVLGTERNTNLVLLEYSSDPHNDGAVKTKNDTVKVYIYGIEIFKYDGTSHNQAGLAGAQFEVYKRTGGEVFPINSTLLSFEGNPNGGYKLSTSNLASTVLVTPNGGTLMVSGLDAGKYWIKEIAAPGGYHLLKNPIAVEIISDTTSPRHVLGRVSPYHYLRIENSKGPTLPDAGGGGTVAFFVVGIMLMACVVVMILGTRRRGLLSCESERESESKSESK